jgi:hypothetical protein
LPIESVVEIEPEAAVKFENRKRRHRSLFLRVARSQHQQGGEAETRCQANQE